MLSINLKWNKQTFEDVKFDPALGVANLKNVIFGLTNVPPERQKMMAKGAWPGTLKDDADLTMLPIKTGQQVMLMGTADKIAPQVTKALFIEDMTNEQKASSGVITPMGFTNLGNTCYMNSVLQVVRQMPELREAMKAVNRSAGNNSNVQELTVTCSLRDTLTSLDKSGEKYTPMSLVNLIRTAYPQYAQQSQQGGGYMQMDAEEFFNTITQVLGSSLPNTPANVAAKASCSQLMDVEFEESMQCLEELQEPVVLKQRAERVNKLVCNIQSSVTHADNPHSSTSDNKFTNVMVEGITMNMEGTLEKRSEILGRNAVWKKRQRISKLPRYLCVQFMRFFWKATPDNRDHAGVKCKIMRPVTFPESFDVFPLCNESLQKSIKANRDAEQKAKEEALERGGSSAPKEVEGITSSSSSSSSAAEMNVDDEDAAALQAAMAMSMSGDAAAAAMPPQPPSAQTEVQATNPFGEHLPANFTGNYELFGVVTHKGRSADSGHYIGWVRQPALEDGSSSDLWWKFDDDVVSEVNTADILNLKGGGDWHTAYMNFYRSKV